MIKDFQILDKKRKIVCKFIRDNPGCTYRDIKCHTKIKVERVFTNLKVAYELSGMPSSENLTKRSKSQQKTEVKEFIINNPGCSITKIQNNVHVNVIRLFGGIQNAYGHAGVNYPPRRITSGVMDPKVISRAKDYERTIIGRLSHFGSVKTNVHTKTGKIDCVLDLNGKSYIVEIKNYLGKNNITMYELKQLMRYMVEYKCDNSIIICPKKSLPKRKNSRNIYKDGLYINILPDSDLWGRSINHLFNTR